MKGKPAPLFPADARMPDHAIWHCLNTVAALEAARSETRAHRLEKKALGLPRNIRPPVQGSFTPSPPVASHHASPVHIDLDRRNGQWAVRAAAFCAVKLPSLAAGRKSQKGRLEGKARSVRSRRTNPELRRRAPATSSPATG
ncbi:MAG: hypothetical protein CFK52_03335 [Chloracidobacterium sp. CP2_5A]|nr:MAG: hypothetical protein CFK52_03335 [Chloracidobacterium sp. CP2_5A]